MNPFQYSRAQSIDQAIQSIRAADGGNARFIAGGTNLLDLMKMNVEQPGQLIDINYLPLSELHIDNTMLSIGALARMSDVAANTEVARRFPVIAQSLLASASPQLRNMASIGGNMMQRTRCSYFRDTACACNKREPGSGCAALGGDNRRHAILGISPHCIATHPSDLAVALMALSARIKLHGPNSDRTVPIDDFFLVPGSTPNLEHNIQIDELIVAIEVPASPLATRSFYLKVRERASFEFALTSAAVALDIRNGVIAESRIVLGGIATKPWRARDAEVYLAGKPVQESHFVAAAHIALAQAQPGKDNKFKVKLAQRTVVRALTTLAAGEIA
ncbi:FAD binding domain-containing protein [Solimicrobium silvestre]|uniref:Aerobic-type carbon monoxide dehydrogenase middle subunit CoxM/CutM-like protein n=1 Tax=Solimicrobium silvestre TaxID=2099400 RepID=A0A2S9GXJ1_9BURK|nr:xanthine dehydrogenase family protein subunit M [Solimicrobium silvestre]PRC92445.1 Aerobic-type carbon monoxide dehydrogenase middle subunit CoxM/CutM -like protein [Solimicrobium silvestre]